MLKIKLDILDGYQVILVQKIKVIKPLLNFPTKYFLPKSLDTYTIG